MRIIILLLAATLGACSTVKDATVLAMKSGNCVHNFAKAEFKRVYCDMNVEQLPSDIIETYRVAYLVVFPDGRKMYVLDALDPAIKVGTSVQVETKTPVHIIKLAH